MGYWIEQDAWHSRRIAFENGVVPAGVSLGTVATLLAACGRPVPAWIEEARVTSPGGRFDAVMRRESIGGVLGVCTGTFLSFVKVPSHRRTTVNRLQHRAGALPGYLFGVE